MRPVDARLSLPEYGASYLLEEFSQYFCVESAFGKAQEHLERVLGQRIPEEIVAALFRDEDRPRENDRPKPQAKRVVARFSRSYEDNGEQAVVTGLRRMATIRGLRGKALKEVTTVCRYFKTNAHRMRYDDYLREGCPIATGAIEGACRHLVKDRMERSGMRWVKEGAEAMLTVRVLHVCDL